MQALFSRFLARIPLETVSKIVRDVEVADPREKPRVPELFWREHLERGTGGTCFARVAAFGALLGRLGFSTEKLAGRVAADLDHAALRVEEKGKRYLCDVGLPLPALLPDGPGEIETPLGRLEVDRTERGLRVRFREGVPEGPRELEIFSAALSEEQFVERWRRTFRSESKFPSAVSLSRWEAGRVLSFSRGAVRVDDLHSRLLVPIAAPRAPRLAELFGIDVDLLAGAFGIVGDPEPERPEAVLTAYLETEAAPEGAFAAIATRERYIALLRGVAEVRSAGETSHGWRLTLEPPDAPPAGEPGATLSEEVACDPARRELRIRRRAGDSLFDSVYRAERREGRTYLVRQAILAGAREDLLRNDSLRGRLAGALAVDLLAWARRLEGREERR